MKGESRWEPRATDRVEARGRGRGRSHRRMPSPREGAGALILSICAPPLKWRERGRSHGPRATGGSSRWGRGCSRCASELSRAGVGKGACWGARPVFGSGGSLVESAPCAYYCVVLLVISFFALLFLSLWVLFCFALLGLPFQLLIYRSIMTTFSRPHSCIWTTLETGQERASKMLLYRDWKSERSGDRS